MKYNKMVEMNREKSRLKMQSGHLKIPASEKYFRLLSHSF